jgi:hypothetical protein
LAAGTVLRGCGEEVRPAHGNQPGGSLKYRGEVRGNLPAFPKSGKLLEKEDSVTSRAAVARPSNPTKTAACTHRWVVESPNGAEVSGRCRHCGATKSFPTVGSRLSWKETLGQFASQRGRRTFAFEMEEEEAFE